MTQNNVKIAITGGIGSGKSTVADFIKKQGYAVYSCDEIYTELLQKPGFVKKISDEFGGLILPDGSLDRKKLSKKVFGNSVALKSLNSLTHPAIMEEVLKRCNGHALTFAEVPLLFEGGYEKFFDGIIIVVREIEDRITSVVQRDNSDRETVISRINSQFDYKNIDFAKYYVLHNDGNLPELEQKTLELLKKIKVSIK